MASKRKSHSFTFEGERYYTKGKTKAEAIRKANEKKAKMLAGQVDESSVLFRDWWEEYLSAYKAGVSDKTVSDYKLIYKKAIEPYIGNVPLKKIKQVNCRKLLNALDGKSKSYVHKTYILLKGALNAAVDNDLLNKSPMRGIEEPDAEEGSRRALTTDERKLFLQATDNCGDAGYYGKIVYYCGLRPSEAMRVRAEDFDRKNRLLSVRGTKTDAAPRTVPVPRILPLPEKSTGLLFVTKNGGVRDEGGQRRWWLKLKCEMERISGKEVAEDLVMYCVRHDYGTRCIEAGVDIETLSKMMGHSSVAITSRIYLHESEAILKNALNKLDVLYEAK